MRNVETKASHCSFVIRRIKAETHSEGLLIEIIIKPPVAKRILTYYITKSIYYQFRKRGSLAASKKTAIMIPCQRQKEAFGERKNMKKKISGRDILFLQAVIIVYTCSSIAAKLAAGCELFSLKFCLFYGIEIVILGVYALLWQQVIKRFELSVAYANRAMVIVWSMLWAALIFKEQLTVSNIAGILLVVTGTFIVNKDTGGAQA